MIVRGTNRDERNFFLIFNQNYNYFSNTSSIRHVIKRYSPLERVTLKLLRIRNAKHPRRNEQRYHCPSSPLGSPHWLPCHEVEGKRSAFFNFGRYLSASNKFTGKREICARLVWSLASNRKRTSKLSM